MSYATSLRPQPPSAWLFVKHSEEEGKCQSEPDPITTERGPDEELRLQFEAVNQLNPDEKEVARAVLEGLVLKHISRKWSGISSMAPVAAPAPAAQPAAKPAAKSAEVTPRAKAAGRRSTAVAR